MEKCTNHKIEISNPSQLVIRVDEYLKLSKKLPFQNESLQNRERQIFESLGPRTLEEYDRTIFSSISLSAVEKKVNDTFQDGIYLEDEMDNVTYPYDRTIRTKPKKLEDPTKEKVLAPKKVPPLVLGNYRIMRDNSLVIQKTNDPLLALSDSFESGHKKR